MTWRGWESYVPRAQAGPSTAKSPMNLSARAEKPNESARAHVGPSTRRGKYGAVKTTVDNIVFDSKKEAARYQELLLLVQSRSIRHLVLQPEFTLNAWSGDHAACPQVGVYRGDFAYEELTETGGRWDPVVEDVKGMKTPLYRWKKKHVEAQYGITIRET